MVSENFSPMITGIDDIRSSQTERIDSPIGNPYRPDNSRIGRWLQQQRFFRIDNIGPDSGTSTSIDKFCLILNVILRQTQEQTVGLFHTMTGNPPKNPVFFNTFLCRFLISHCIAGTTMQQTVISSRRSRRYIESLDQKHTNPSTGTVSGNSSTGCATADYNHIKWLGHIILFHLCRKLYFHLQRNKQFKTFQKKNESIFNQNENK